MERRCVRARFSSCTTSPVTYICIVSLYKEEGLTTSVHGNTGKVPINTFSKEQVEAVKQFIENYGEAHGLPLPGRLSNAREKTLLLPSDMLKSFVLRKYKEASTNPVEVLFFKLWGELRPYVYVAMMKPSSDLCFT